jgi:hypothetical protein
VVGASRTTTLGYTHILIAVDKFSKWVEARPIASLSGETTTCFIKDIVVRYDIPNSIITNNGSNLSRGELEQYFYHMGMQLYATSTVHPRSNGQVGCMSGLILHGIFPWLEDLLHRAEGAWMEEFLGVLWSIRITPKRSTGYTPFFLAIEHKL